MFKKQIRNFSSLVVVQILNYLLPLVTLPIVVRIIGPEKFGIINYLNSLIGYFVLLIGYSFELSATRHVTSEVNNPKVLNQVFNKVFLAKSILFILSTVIFVSLFFFYSEILKDRIVAVFTYLLCVGALFDFNWVYVAKHDVHYTAAINLTIKILLNLSLLVFIRHQSDYIYHPLITGLAQVGLGVIAFVWAIKRYKISIEFPRLSEVWRVLWADKVLFFHSLSHTIYTTLNIVILGFMRSPLEVGYYSAGWKLIILIQVLLISPSTIVLFPVIGESFARDKNAGVLAIQRIIPFVLIVTTLIGIGILLFADVAVNILYGYQFGETVSIFRILSFMPMMLAVNMIFGVQAMVNLKMDSKFFAITFSAAVISVCLNYFFIRQMGVSGAAISWFATETFCAVLMFITLTRNNIRILDLRYFKPNAILESINLVLNKK